MAHDLYRPNRYAKILACIIYLSAFSSPSVLSALPFDVETTIRHSKKVVSQGPAPFYEKTYSALSSDSQDLAFQEFRYTTDSSKTVTEPRFLAFATKDGSLDDFFANPRQCSSAHSHVYWLDLFSGVPVCVSYDDSGAVQGEAFGQLVAHRRRDEAEQ